MVSVDMPSPCLRRNTEEEADLREGPWVDQMFCAGGNAASIGLVNNSGHEVHTTEARGRRSMCVDSYVNYATRMLLTGMWTIGNISVVRATGQMISPTEFDEIANSSHYHKANANRLRYLDELSFVG